MDRRNFIRFGLAATASGLVVPTASLAADTQAGEGGIYYTKNQPGRWAAKAGGHVPQISLQKNMGKTGRETLVEVVTPHEVKGFEHYIVKHILLDKKYNILAEYLFDPTKELQPRSEFKLGSYNGPIFALSVCNKHDTWLSMSEA